MSANTIGQDEVIEERKIYKTVNYDQFKIMQGNRNRSKTDINSFAKVLTEKGNFMHLFPIEVNEHGFIIDGQKRFMAAKQLSEPVCYVILPDANVDTVITRNTNTDNWKWIDYAYSWANRSNQPYVEFVRLYEEYRYNYFTLIKYVGFFTLGSTYSTSTIRTSFNDGNLVIKDIALTRKLLQQYSELLQEAGQIRHSNEFSYAVYSMMRTPGYNHERMRKQVRNYGDDLLRCYTEIDYMYELEKIAKKAIF